MSVCPELRNLISLRVWFWKYNMVSLCTAYLEQRHSFMSSLQLRYGRTWIERLDTFICYLCIIWIGFHVYMHTNRDRQKKCAAWSFDIVSQGKTITRQDNTIRSRCVGMGTKDCKSLEDEVRCHVRRNKKDSDLDFAYVPGTLHGEQRLLTPGACRNWFDNQEPGTVTTETENGR